MWAATSGSSGIGPARKLREDLPIERGMRLPRLSSHDAPVAHGLIAYICCAGLLRFQTHVFIAGHTFARRQPRGSQHLDAVADCENPLSLPVKRPHNVEDPGIIPQVLGRSATQYEHGGVF